MKIGAKFKVTFTTSVESPQGLKPMDRFRAVLSNPGFSTHSSRQGMRNIFLVIDGVKVGVREIGVMHVLVCQRAICMTNLICVGTKSFSVIMNLGFVSGPSDSSALQLGL